MEQDGLAGALMLYAPDARLRAGTMTVSGRRNIAPNFRISSADSFFRKSQIVEQWVEVPPPVGSRAVTLDPSNEGPVALHSSPYPSSVRRERG